MARNKERRPEWFKFWRRNRQQLDIEQLSMKSRGVVLTNIMRYFDGTDDLISMSAVETMAFNVIKISIDSSYAEYEDMRERNSENGKKGGRPSKTEVNRKNPVGFSETEKTRRQKTEEKEEREVREDSVRSYSTEDMEEYPPGTGYYRPRSEVSKIE